MSLFYTRFPGAVGTSYSCFIQQTMLPGTVQRQLVSFKQHKILFQLNLCFLTTNFDDSIWLWVQQRSSYFSQHDLVCEKRPEMGDTSLITVLLEWCVAVSCVYCLAACPFPTFIPTSELLFMYQCVWTKKRKNSFTDGKISSPKICVIHIINQILLTYLAYLPLLIG